MYRTCSVSTTKCRSLRSGRCSGVTYVRDGRERLVEVHHEGHAIKYRLRVVPRLWLLKRRQRTRIFQRMRVPDIVTRVPTPCWYATNCRQIAWPAYGRPAPIR